MYIKVNFTVITYTVCIKIVLISNDKNKKNDIILNSMV